MTKRDRLIILGSGYVARFIPSLRSFYSTVLHTSRDPDNHLSWVPVEQRVLFDLEQADTWKNLPSMADVLWCFPAAPIEAVRRFAQERAWEKLVVLGSTSAYDVGSAPAYPPPWIDETALIDLKKPRVQGEELLRQDCGAVLLRVAGIYGPDRHPYRWIRSGLVGLSDKYVNLIHVEDLAEICLAALQWGVRGAAYNVSDGIPRTWREIGSRLNPPAGADPPAREQGRQLGKRLNTAKLRALLQEARIAIRHPDLFRSLEYLDEAEGPSSTR
jgi:hypothetical protein